MKYFYNLKSVVSEYLESINWSALGGSVAEVLWLTIFSLGPLIFNIVIAAIAHESFCIWKEKIVPGEILSYCLSFIAPSLYLFVKSQGTEYKLPYLHAFSIVTLAIYALSTALYLIVKNKWVANINQEPRTDGVFFSIVLIFLLVTIIFRIYSIYHGKAISNWSNNRVRQQNDFNEQFTKSLNK